MSSGFREYLDAISGSGMLRVIHMVLNGAAAAAGIFLMVTGVAGLTDMYKTFGGIAMPLTCAILGGLVTFVAFLGVIGAIKRSEYMFGTYSALLTILVAVQVIALMIVWLRPGHIEDRFSSVWEGLYDNDQDTIRSIEKDLRCCGFKSPVDMAVPANCSVKKHYGFAVGCLEPLQHQWHARRKSMLWAGAAIVSAQVLSLVMGAELARRYKRAREGGYQRVPARNEGSPLLRA
ncbi:Tetraspanin family-domain-containing protein [Kickxella alabastrina]|uniref:Tetraspanin family-domain-containing protein n=1 Tax=Kickxella alabastrina TaxID=61397 RepID=UPI00221EB9BE|nr:Tetraspanin family-domain-containing protein [Kickxella alabastrina]XP_051390956.1 Tetraspanin family-domain-containing protein [Kickxella alabastrina]KAI7826292.1 Tetraspanin family-domain-containing protein [Kickxella alabastrina]KAI7826300.1 Tetraspanin family-domain-containing protein [Kickxella alabastrina]